MVEPTAEVASAFFKQHLKMIDKIMEKVLQFQMVFTIIYENFGHLIGQKPAIDIQMKPRFQMLLEV